MKKIITLILTVVALAFSGCSTRMTPSVASTVAQMYDTTKTIWVKGQEIVVINSDLLDAETLAQLNKIDENAKFIDSIVHPTGENLIKIDNEALDRIIKTKEVIER